MNDKPKYNPAIHHRRSIRLKGYDYSQAGLYFITICVQNRDCLFGNIVVGADLRVCRDIQGEHVGSPQQVAPKLKLNDAGIMVEKWYHELENKFPDIKCHEMIVMPNHFHCILEIVVGTDLRVCPDVKGEHIGSPQHGEHIGSPLHGVIQWFKTMTTNEYIRGVKLLNWQPFNGKLWQRNYYEHIIRNEQSYQNISEYIVNNPEKWAEDKFHNS